MRIAHVAPVIYPVPPLAYGGTERVIADLATAQLAMGHEPVLFGPADSALGGVRVIGAYPSLAAHQREAQSALPPGFPAELEARQISDLLRHLPGFDVVHLHGSAHASGVCAALGLPTFRTIHWRADEADHREHFAAFPDERVIAISASQAAAVPAASLAGVVHHGLPEARYAVGSGEGGYLAFIGRMTDQKRPDRAIALAREVGLPLRLAGPIDPGNPAYFDRVVAPLLSPDVVHVGSITDAQKQPFLGDAAALVFPIDWPEPFGLVMIEAMACGTPVIAWNRGSVPEVVEDGVTGIVVATLAEAVARLPQVLALDRQVIRQRFEERFTAARMASAIAALYEVTLAQRSASDSRARSPSP
ncbi:glycosyltransferase [Erythrobacter arachoides]|uniref:Glycosyltransferase n=1 Tax=Aurantiacibacter arachoides TaxID=1850444 RepID=A0A845A4L2_9SPHN|nr:glycosyltransferase [Aurantiacibacter arachoides]MXO94362.1 glycosyltransferase [Aurantiacibacter arachoides]GGD64049.1 glycosyl transferase [Aurantiacibacter arachoides]